MLQKLIKLADRLDKQGLHELADKLDNLIVALAEGAEGNISLVELMRLKPDVIMPLAKAISFDLVLEPDPEGKGNNVKAIPKIHDKWTDGLNLGDVSKSPKLQEYMVPGVAEETAKQLEKGEWYDPEADMPFAKEKDVKFAPETLRDIRLENLQRGRGQQQGRDIDEALSGAIQEVERETFLPESERSEEAQYYDLPTVPPSGFSYDPEYRKQQEKIRRQQHKMMSETEAQIRSELVKMADDFDQTGRYDLASDVDQALKSLSARPAAPLKKLDDDIKKNLIIFVHDADKNTSKSIEGLNELFRRMRYFDFADAVRELGLDKTVKEMEKTRSALDEAKRKFYEMMHGKKPTKKDLEELFESLVEGIEETKEQNSLDFFEEQLKKEQAAEDSETASEEYDESAADDPTPEKDLAGFDSSELLGSFEAGPEGVRDLDKEEDLTEEMEEELSEFLAGLEEE